MQKRFGGDSFGKRVISMKKAFQFIGRCLRSQWNHFRAEPLSHFICWGILILLIYLLPEKGSAGAGNDHFLACIFAVLASAFFSAIFRRRSFDGLPLTWQERVGDFAFGVGLTLLYLRAGFWKVTAVPEFVFYMVVLVVAFAIGSVFWSWGKRPQAREEEG